MIFNCDSCGKSISNKRDTCPYCRVDIVEFSMMVEKKKLFGENNLSESIKEKLRGSLANLGF